MIHTKGKLLAWVRSPVSEEDFAALYQTELPKIYNFFRFRVGDGPLAEDLTAETFEKAWRKRKRYRHDLASFSTWLYTIARRVAIDYYRQRRPEIPYESTGPLTADETPEDLTVRQADFDRLSVLLAQLEERDRELVALRYGAGLTNRAIAGLKRTDSHRRIAEQLNELAKHLLNGPALQDWPIFDPGNKSASQS